MDTDSRNSALSNAYRLRWVLAALAVALVAIALPRVADLLAGGSPRTDAASATALSQRQRVAIPPEELESVLDEYASGVFAAADPRLPAPSFTVTDGRGHVLDEAQYSQAGMAEVEYAGETRVYALSLGYSQAEVEGDLRQNCAQRVEEGVFLECSVSDLGEITVLEKYKALRLEIVDGAVIRSEIIPAGELNPDEQTWFKHSIQVIHNASGQINSASESVQAASLESATQEMQVGVDSLQRLASEPELVLGRPE